MHKQPSEESVMILIDLGVTRADIRAEFSFTSTISSKNLCRILSSWFRWTFSQMLRTFSTLGSDILQLTCLLCLTYSAMSLMSTLMNLPFTNSIIPPNFAGTGLDTLHYQMWGPLTYSRVYWIPPSYPAPFLPNALILAELLKSVYRTSTDRVFYSGID